MLNCILTLLLLASVVLGRIQNSKIIPETGNASSNFCIYHAAYYPIKVGWWDLPLEGRAGSTGTVQSRGSVEAPTFSLQPWPVKTEKEERGEGKRRDCLYVLCLDEDYWEELSTRLILVIKM